MGLLDDKVALVTGGGRGIGYGITKVFTREGACVVMMGRNETTLKEAEKTIEKDGGTARGFPGDISKSNDVQKVIDATVREFGGLDILIANAGINPVTPILDITEEEWDAVMDINVKGTFFCVQYAARRMIELQTLGRIVIVSSVDGNIVVPGESHYGASKAALTHFTRIAAVELIQKGIYVNAIAPGWVYTDLLEEELRQPERKQYWIDHIPAHRIATIEDIGETALFLSRDDVGQSLVGTVITVDGAHSIVLHGMETT